MVTGIQNAIASTALLQLSGTGGPRQQPDNAGSGSHVEDKVTLSQGANAQAGQESSAQAAKLINQTDRVYAKQQDLLKKMDEQLQGIVKQYPPYGNTDPKRLEYLKSFDGLRREIEALQFPKDPQAEQGLPQGVALPTGQASLGLPNLSGASVTDAQVGNAASYVQSALAQVTQQRERLANSVHAALGGSTYSSLVKSLT